MATGSALVALKQAVIAALQARAALDGVVISYGEPDQWSQENVWLGDAQAGTEIRVMRAGTKPVEELVTVDLYVQVAKDDGDTQENADLRAVTLFAEVQQALAETPKLDDAVYWVQLRGWQHFTGTLVNRTGAVGGHGSRFAARLEFRARLYP